MLEIKTHPYHIHTIESKIQLSSRIPSRAFRFSILALLPIIVGGGTELMGGEAPTDDR